MTADIPPDRSTLTDSDLYAEYNLWKRRSQSKPEGAAQTAKVFADQLEAELRRRGLRVYE